MEVLSRQLVGYKVLLWILSTLNRVLLPLLWLVIPVCSCLSLSLCLLLLEALNFSVVMQVQVVDGHKDLVTPILAECTGCSYVYMLFIC